MKVLGVIPARGGSKGVPRKNIKELAGKPLIQYTIEEAQKVASITELIVSTEDEEIATISQQLGAKVPFLRPEALAGDKVPTIEVLIDILKRYKEEGQEFDCLCLLQPTTPFTKHKDIEEAISIFKASSSDSLLSVLEVPHEYNPHWVFKPRENNQLEIATGEKEIITRRQELPKAYIRSGDIYLTKTQIVLEGSIYGKSISYYEMPDCPHINIDTLEDWRKAEEIASSGKI